MVKISWSGFIAVSFLALLFVSGCSKTVAERDALEGKDPIVLKARSEIDAGDIDEAIKLLLQAVETKPAMARPHLELALLYDDYKKDYVRAVYHYTRYLELRPDTEKRKIIEKYIGDAKTAFAAEISAETLIDARISALERENEDLQAGLQEARRDVADAKQIEKTPSPLRRTVKTEPDVKTADAAAGIKPTDAPPVQEDIKTKKAGSKFEIYYVRPKDTLSTIAAAVYNDAGKWKRIYDANRDTIPDSDRLRVGQALIIPR